jgi:hypothetical protein
MEDVAEHRADHWPETGIWEVSVRNESTILGEWSANRK